MQCLGLDDVSKIFLDESERLLATVRDHALTHDALFARTETRERRQVAKGDDFAAGVALRMEGASVKVRPFALRLVCVNGAVLPCLGDEDQVDLELLPGLEVQEARIRESIQDCAKVENLHSYLNGMENLRDPIAFAIMLSEFARRFGSGLAVDVLQSTVSGPQSRSGFDLLNAITARAREERDPRRKWDLETFGGEVPAFVERSVEVRSWGQTEELPLGELVREFA
jgi:hypothetical protein